MGCVDFRRPGTFGRQAQQHQARRRVRRDGDRRNFDTVIRNREKGAVRQDRLCCQQRDLPRFERNRVDFDPAKADALQRHGIDGPAHQPFGVPVLLLQVLGTQEQSLGPDDLVSVSH